MTDNYREHIELAAKASGVNGAWSSGRPGIRTLKSTSDDLVWNPRESNADAFWLASFITAYGWSFASLDVVAIEALQKRLDVEDAMRHAITLAAAEYGKAMP